MIVFRAMNYQLLSATAPPRVTGALAAAAHKDKKITHLRTDVRGVDGGDELPQEVVQFPTLNEAVPCHEVTDN